MALSSLDRRHLQQFAKPAGERLYVPINAQKRLQRAGLLAYAGNGFRVLTGAGRAALKEKATT